MISKILKNKQAILLHMIVTNDHNRASFERFIKEGYSDSLLTKKDWIKIAKVVKQYIHKSTTKEITEVLYKLNEKRIAKILAGGTVNNSNRLYPLSNEDYDKFAEYVWNKRGNPTNNKRIISGIRWGIGKVKDNGKWGWDRVVYSRYIGVYINKNKIEISVPS